MLLAIFGLLTCIFLDASIWYYVVGGLLVILNLSTMEKL